MTRLSFDFRGLGAALAALGLVACDAAPPSSARPDAVRGPDAVLTADARPADAFVPADAALPRDAEVALPSDAALQVDAASPPDATPPAVDRPNFVFILGEARGWTSTSVLQHEEVADSRSDTFETPNLDRIAAEGLTFSDFYAPSPRCMPSRASYFTGRSPAQLHMTFIPEGNRDGATMGQIVPPVTVTDLPTNVPNVASVLHGAGYATAHFGKWHAGRTDPAAYGFDESDGPTSNRGPDGTVHPNPVEAFATAERGMDFMARQVAAGRPFYLQVSHYGGSEEMNALPETFAAERARLPGAPVAIVAESAVLRDADTTIGLLLDQLDALGVADRTYVYFSADHGRAGVHSNEPLYQGKGSVWEGGVRVPLLIRGPRVPAGAHAHVRASQVDLLPTLAELAGVTDLPRDGLEGGSLAEVLRSGTGRVDRPSEAFVVHFPHYDKDPLGPSTSILLGRFKLIRFYEDDSRRLYDLESDLGEENDLAAALPERVAELDAAMTAYLTAVGAQMPTRL